MTLRIALALLLLATQSACIIATEQSPFLRLESDAATQYNHRGMVRNDRAVLQTALDLELQTKIEGWVNVGVWTNLDIYNSTGDAWFSSGQGGRFTEIDLYATYSERYRGLDWTFGVLSDNPTRGPSFPFAARSASAEVFLETSKEFVLATPRLEVHWDFDKIDGAYLAAGVGHELSLSDALTLAADVSLGYSSPEHSLWIYGTQNGGFSDLAGTLTARYAHSDQVALRAQVAGTSIIDTDIQNGFDRNSIASDNLWMSIGIEWSH